jgi:hypothetical protein
MDTWRTLISRADEGKRPKKLYPGIFKSLSEPGSAFLR